VRSAAVYDRVYSAALGLPKRAEYSGFPLTSFKNCNATIGTVAGGRQREGLAQPKLRRRDADRDWPEREHPSPML
jgi:hypothetical protein